MKFNFLAIGIASILPILIGFVWYSPKLGFGKAWMEVTGIKEEDGKNVNMKLVLGLTLFYSFILAFLLQSVVIHQVHIYNFLHEQKDFSEPGSMSSRLLQEIMDNYATSYRSFKHGALHGTIAGIFFALPVIAIPALFEQRGAKYIAIHSGYWIVSLALMGGIICAMM